MKATYSIYEAKTYLSELIRTVKGKRVVTITERGKPVAQVIPFEPATRETLAERIANLTRDGAIVPAKRSPTELRPIGRIPGALKKFLAERD